MTEYEKCLREMPFDGAEKALTDMALNARRSYEKTSYIGV